MRRELSVTLHDMLSCMSRAVDMVSPALSGHHRRTAYLSMVIGEDCGLSDKDMSELISAAYLHDIGALSMRERLGEMMEFESDSPYRHAEMGYRHLKSFDSFSGAASLVRFHHVPWNKGKGQSFRGHTVPLGSHILHLAERVDLLIDRRQDAPSQLPGIFEAIRKRCARSFMPELIDIFAARAHDAEFWGTLGDSKYIDGSLAERSRLSEVVMNLDGLIGLTKFFCRIIDFRSRFTAMHSSGVAATAEALAVIMGMPENDWKTMRAAGYLHDLGKLSVPTEILEKPSRLTPEETTLVRMHSFKTHSVLDGINGLTQMNRWASFHHERLDGNGYPFGKTEGDMDLGCRIIAVADVFTALKEDRPYREGMDSERAFGELSAMADSRALDPKVVDVLKYCYDEVDYLRVSTQREASRDYELFGLPL